MRVDPGQVEGIDDVDLFLSEGRVFRNRKIGLGEGLFGDVELLDKSYGREGKIGLLIVSPQLVDDSGGPRDKRVGIY